MLLRFCKNYYRNVLLISILFLLDKIFDTTWKTYLFYVKLSFARYSVYMVFRVNIYYLTLQIKLFKGLSLFHLTICSEKKERYIDTCIITYRTYIRRTLIVCDLSRGSRWPRLHLSCRDVEQTLKCIQTSMIND